MRYTMHRAFVASLLLAGCVAALAVWSLPPAVAEDDKTAAEEKQPAEEKAQTEDKAQSEEKAADAASEPKSHTAKKGPLQTTVELEGVFEATQTTEVVLHPQTWTTFLVLDAVAQGTRVSQGDRLITLDMQPIDEAIADLEAELALGEIALRSSAEDIRLLEKSIPIDTAVAERSRSMAEEDLAYFRNVERSLYERQSYNYVKSSEFYLEMEEEELNQLQKMYEADDLTEETEEIILKRQQFYVEMGRFYLEMARINHDETLQMMLPRYEQRLTQQLDQQMLALERLRTAAPMELNMKRLERERLTRQQDRSAQRLKKLRHDREAMALRAPVGGLLYYGPCVRGQWTSAADLTMRLRRGGAINPHEVVLTIVEPRPVVVRATLPEKELEHVSVGQSATVVPTAMADARVAAQVKEISLLPVTSGSFDIEIEVTPGDELARIVPGMACRVKLVAYRNAEALLVPASAVFADPLDEDSRHVFVITDAGHEKRAVRVGHKSGDEIEIVEGLSEGDRILAEDPAKKSE